jgi:hypothetical protein
MWVHGLVADFLSLRCVLARQFIDAINTVVYRLRGLYDLMPEDAAAKRGEMTARAEKMAGEKIDRMLEKSDQPDAVKAKRKRRLTKPPAELK